MIYLSNMALQGGKGNIAIFGHFSMVTSKPKGFFKTVCMVKILLEICKMGQNKTFVRDGFLI